MNAWMKCAGVTGMLVATLGIGCRRERTVSQSVTPDQFYLRGQGVAENPLSGVDQPGAIRDRNLDGTSGNVDSGAKPDDARQPTSPVSPNDKSEGPISDTVREQVRPPEPAGEGEPRSALPSTVPAASSGTYMTIGGVVAEVNGTPIFANKILKLQETLLSTKAAELNPKQFQALAKTQIDKQLRELISNELEFAAAERNLDQADRGLAEMLTIKWRGEQITQAGGSVELARKHAAADGVDFDELVNQRYRFHMTQVYYQKKVIPQIQVSADDMRRFYNANLSSKFTEQEQAEFRLIKVDPKQHTGGRDEAYKIVRDLRDRATTGHEDFATLASETNDDPRLRKSGGDLGLGPVQRGAFVLEDVEKAVWNLQPGDVTDVVEAKGSFYLAKLVNRTAGRTMQFEDPAVQDRIRNTLRGEQFATRRDQVRGNLEKGAVIRVDDAMVQTAVDMAMQRYTQWAVK